ncbi:MAG: nucleotidyl transferase AbiEii/AbiGii toxin family protein [bacterium]|nr:nucleotidyl transferase AbiEii/AbiGii toxin family protein [bacterium]
MFTAVLSQDAQDALAVLGRSGLLSQAYLAGGSALALQFGHRRSVDFDFFSPHEFSPDKLRKALSLLGAFETTFAKGITLLGVFEGVKFSYFQYEYPLVDATITHEGIAIANLKDIAAMKLAAIMDRGKKRDFIDLFVLAHQGLTFDVMLKVYDQKYHALESNMFSLFRAMNYFDEADTTDMPEMLIPLSWEEIKKFFIAESMRLAKKYLEESP